MLPFYLAAVLGQFAWKIADAAAPQPSPEWRFGVTSTMSDKRQKWRPDPVPSIAGPNRVTPRARGTGMAARRA